MLPFYLFAEAIGDGCGSRLVHSSEDIEAGNEPGVLGGLPLGVVEIRRDCDHGIGDSLAKASLRGLAKPGEDHGRDLLGRGMLGLAFGPNFHHGV